MNTFIAGILLVATGPAQGLEVDVTHGVKPHEGCGNAAPLPITSVTQELRPVTSAGGKLWFPILLDGVEHDVVVSLDSTATKPPGGNGASRPARGGSASPGRSVTFQGVLAGESGTRVAGSLAGGRLEGVILAPEGLWSFEPSSSFRAVAPLHSVQKFSDHPHQPETAASTGSPVSYTIAVDTDSVWFFNSGGGSMASAQDRIEAQFVIVDAIYEYYLGISLELGPVILRDGSPEHPDPYAAGEPYAGASQKSSMLASVWDDLDHIQRDAVVWLSGTSTPGADGGAFGSLCGGFCWAKDLVPVIAHELGHLFGAEHCNTPPTCNGGSYDPLDCQIMHEGSIGYSFGPCSIDQIDANLPCGEPGVPGSPPVVQSVPALPYSGAQPVLITGPRVGSALF